MPAPQKPKLTPNDVRAMRAAAQRSVGAQAAPPLPGTVPVTGAPPPLPGAIGAPTPPPPLPFDWSVPQPSAEERAAVEAAFKALADATRSLADLILLIDKHPEFWLSWAKAAKAGTMTF